MTTYNVQEVEKVVANRLKAPKGFLSGRRRNFQSLRGQINHVRLFHQNEKNIAIKKKQSFYQQIHA